MKRLFAISTILALATGAAHAGTRGLTAIPSIKHHPKKCFYAGETNFDIISIYVDPQTQNGNDSYGDSEKLEDGAGGGIALSHFYTENFGLMGRAYWWDAESVIHSVTASAILRYPIQDWCVAPYIFGGLGGHFDSENQLSGHFGAGLECRLTDKLGLVADYSYTWTEQTDDWHLYTLGLRVSF